jgi:DNA-binding HxlR family transcriptional regulator
VTERRAGLAGTASPAEILAADCPARRVLCLIGDKWTPVVIYGLSDGVHRFSELQHRIPDISKKMLIQVLRKLERAKLVERTVHHVVPPQTEYRLTEAGSHLHEPVALLCQWANHNTRLLDAIDGAQRQSAERGAPKA